MSSASLLLAREGCMALRLAPLTLASSLRVGPVFEISWYHTGIWPFFYSFGTGMVWWYAKVVCEI